MDQIVTMAVIYILRRCGFLHALFLSFWTKLCLIQPWPCYIIGFCSFNVWCVSIDKDCLEVVDTHFDYSARLVSSRKKTIDKVFFLEYSKSLEMKINVLQAPCTRNSNFTSGAVLILSLLLFFLLFFPFFLIRSNYYVCVID